MRLIMAALLLALAGGCATGPALLFAVPPDNLAQRQIQTRVFATQDEKQILAASAAVLQDMGYTLEESETRLGVLTASKMADATSGVQIGLVILSVMLDGDHHHQQVAVDKEQKIRATLVVLPRQGGDGYAVRLTLQRVVWNTAGQVSRTETIKNNEVYSDFFDKLGKSVFLEAQRL
ncbi:MAG: hypothetical protein HY940_02900 [Gammaproteobacteria bacterium]|nr:hypothetical protein [Gammaproteobacteria bacterium]